MRGTNSVPAHTSQAAGLVDFAFLGIQYSFPPLLMPTASWTANSAIPTSQTVNHNLAERHGYGLGHKARDLPRSVVLYRWPRQGQAFLLLEALLRSGEVGPMFGDCDQS